MQLATSSTPPADSNSFALLMRGAAPSADGPALPGTPCEIENTGGFESLLPEIAAKPAASPAAPMATPIDLRGGVPLAFLPGAIHSAIPDGGEIGGDEGNALGEEILSDPSATKPSTVMGDSIPRGFSRVARLFPRAAGADARREAPASDEKNARPDLDAALLAMTGIFQLAPVDPAPLETISLESETAEDDSPGVLSDSSDEDARSLGDQTEVAWSRPEPHLAFGLPVRQARVVPNGTSSEDAGLPDVEGKNEKAVVAVAPFTKIQPEVANSPRVPVSRGESDLRLSRPAAEPNAEIQSAKLDAEGLNRSSVQPPNGESSASQPTNPTMQSRNIGDDQTVLSAEQIRSRGGLRLGRANIAAAAAKDEAVQEGAFGMLEKSFVSSEEERVAKYGEFVGTEAAKSGPTMPANSFHSPSQSPASEVLPVAVATERGLAERIESHNVLALALDDVRSAHEAVEVVLRTADRLSSLVHKSVRLEFSVGDEKLGVRVELRANEVRTTFHTESAELRGALASEWQSVASSAGHGDRTLRILPAQFGGSDQSATNGFSGDASSRHRDAQSQAQPYGTATFSSGSRNRSDRTAVEARTAEVSFAAPSTALHLHTLA